MKKQRGMVKLSGEEVMNLDRYAELTGIELVEVGQGWARAELDVKQQHMNGLGVCQGGAIYTLADYTGAAAANSGGIATYTVCGNIQYIRSGKRGRLYAEGRVDNIDRKLSRSEVTITTAEGLEVARYQSINYRELDDEEEDIPESVETNYESDREAVFE